MAPLNVPPAIPTTCEQLGIRAQSNCPKRKRIVTTKEQSAVFRLVDFQATATGVCMHRIFLVRYCQDGCVSRE